MKCACCLWRTPLSRLDLFSRRCDVCAWLRKNFRDQAPDVMRRAGQNRRAGEEIARGSSAEEVTARLVDLGRTPDQAATVVRSLVAQRAAEIAKLRERLRLPDDCPDDEVRLRAIRGERRRARRRGAVMLAGGVGHLALAGWSVYATLRLGVPGLGCLGVYSTLAGGLLSFLGVAELITGRAEFEKAVFKLHGAKKK